MSSIQVASFDIGFRNFAFCIEEVEQRRIDLEPWIVAKNRYNKDGTATPAFQAVLESLTNTGKINVLVNIDLTSTENAEDNLYLTLTCVLDKYKEMWDKCSYFVIEQQVSFGTSHNVKALKLAQHCISYFMIYYGREKQVIEYPAYNKTKLLGCAKDTCIKQGKESYKSIDKPQRKKWAVVKALSILKARGDHENEHVINQSKKKDDLSDVICQLQAFKISHLYKRPSK